MQSETLTMQQLNFLPAVSNYYTRVQVALAGSECREMCLLTRLWESLIILTLEPDRPFLYIKLPSHLIFVYVSCGQRVWLSCFHNVCLYKHN